MNVKVTSLRGRLLFLIVLPLLIIVSIGTVALYYDSEKKSQEIYDKLLHSISQVILRDVVISEGDLLTEQLLETLTDTLNDQIFYQPVRIHVERASQRSLQNDQNHEI